MIRWIAQRNRLIIIAALAVWAVLVALYLNDAPIMARIPLLGWLGFLAFVLPVVLIGEILWLVGRRFVRKENGGQG